MHPPPPLCPPPCACIHQGCQAMVLGTPPRAGFLQRAQVWLVLAAKPPTEGSTEGYLHARPSSPSFANPPPPPPPSAHPINGGTCVSGQGRGPRQGPGHTKGAGQPPPPPPLPAGRSPSHPHPHTPGVHHAADHAGATVRLKVEGKGGDGPAHVLLRQLHTRGGYGHGCARGPRPNTPGPPLALIPGHSPPKSTPDSFSCLCLMVEGPCVCGGAPPALRPEASLLWLAPGLGWRSVPREALEGGDAQPLSPSRQVPASTAFVTDSNRPQPFWRS